MCSCDYRIYPCGRDASNRLQSPHAGFFFASFPDCVKGEVLRGVRDNRLIMPNDGGGNWASLKVVHCCRKNCESDNHFGAKRSNVLTAVRNNKWRESISDAAEWLSFAFSVVPLQFSCGFLDFVPPYNDFSGAEVWIFLRRVNCLSFSYGNTSWCAQRFTSWKLIIWGAQTAWRMEDRKARAMDCRKRSWREFQEERGWCNP